MNRRSRKSIPIKKPLSEEADVEFENSASPSNVQTNETHNADTNPLDKTLTINEEILKNEVTTNVSKQKTILTRAKNRQSTLQNLLNSPNIEPEYTKPEISLKRKRHASNRESINGEINEDSSCSTTSQMTQNQIQQQTSTISEANSEVKVTEIKCPLDTLCDSKGSLKSDENSHKIVDLCPYYYKMDLIELNTRRLVLQEKQNSESPKNKTTSETYRAKVLKLRNEKIRKDELDNEKIPSISDLEVSNYDLDLFKDALLASASQDAQPLITPSNSTKKLIQFGNYEIETWYKSPYPDDYLILPKIYLCEFCLKYMKTKEVLNRHLEKCLWKHPPGKEIYRKDDISFFEVDGEFNKIYCQNLCLLAKLFLDHKTLYFDVEPFLFYVLTKYNREQGTFNMIGYFSKEKQSIMNFNLSCILTLPQFMNQGFGKLLIDFSYLLSRVENKIGSPERPLSDLGLVSYRTYWKSKLLYYLNIMIDNDDVSIRDLSHETGIHVNDIISTFQYIGIIKYWKGKHVILKNKELINKYINKYKMDIHVDEAHLKWTPYVNTYDINPLKHQLLTNQINIKH